MSEGRPLRVLLSFKLWWSEFKRWCSPKLPMVSCVHSVNFLRWAWKTGSANPLLGWVRYHSDKGPEKDILNQENFQLSAEASPCYRWRLRSTVRLAANTCRAWGERGQVSLWDRGDRGRRWGGQRLEWCNHKPRKTGSHRELVEQERILSPGDFRGSTALPIPDSRLLAQHWERMLSIACISFSWQPQEIRAHYNNY